MKSNTTLVIESPEQLNEVLAFALQTYRNGLCFLEPAEAQEYTVRITSEKYLSVQENKNQLRFALPA